MASALIIKGHATIPKAIREHLHIQSGFFLHPAGSVVILPKLPTLDEMHAAATGAKRRPKRMSRTR